MAYKITNPIEALTDFQPLILPSTTNEEILNQIEEALKRGLAVRVGRWKATPTPNVVLISRTLEDTSEALIKGLGTWEVHWTPSNIKYASKVLFDSWIKDN